VCIEQHKIVVILNNLITNQGKKSGISHSMQSITSISNVRRMNKETKVNFEVNNWHFSTVHNISS
jgi:hypothetical protein